MTDAPPPPPDATPRGLFAWLWRGYLHRHKASLAAAMGLMALEGASLGFLASRMEPMFDDVFVNRVPGAIWVVGGSIALVFALRAVSALAQRVILARVAEKSAAALRLDLLRHLMALDGPFHRRHPPGVLIERVQGDVQAIGSVWTSIVTGVGRDAVALASLLAVTLWVDWVWTLVALVGVPLLILPAVLVQRLVRGRARAARELAGLMATRLDEIFHLLSAVKLSGTEGYQARRFEGLLRRRVRAEVRGAAGRAAIPAMVDVMSGVGFVAVLWVGGTQIGTGGRTVGEFMAFFTAMSLAFDPMRRLAALSGTWTAAAASVERLKAVLDARPALAAPARARAPPGGVPEVELRDVHLGYGELPVLRGLSLRAEAGRTTALVGPSGAGKTTVFNLIARMVDAEAGEVRIGGVEVRDLTLPALRGLLSVVSQDSLLFDESLRENVLLGRTDVSEARLREVLEAAHVADFLGALPQGLDTAVGPRGSALSGGQRQRVAIARALLRDTPVLLLDEATSALDTRSEAVVQEALDRLAQGRTTLVIAHRLSTIRGADRIVVMDGGRAVDAGTHEELLARGGLYAELHRLQFGGEGGAAPRFAPPGMFGSEERQGG